MAGSANLNVMMKTARKAGRGLLKDFGERIRDVSNGPDGYIYILTDKLDGQLLRLEPKK